MATSEIPLQVETLREIQQTAVKAAGAAGKVLIAKIPDHPRGNYLLVGDDGHVSEHELPLPPRRTLLNSVAAVGDYAKHARDVWEAEPAVYYCPDVVRVLLEDGGRHQQPDAAHVFLNKTPAWEQLKKWSDDPSQAWLGHRAFLTALRVEFGDCFERDDLRNLTDAIGQLDFVQGERTQSVAVRNRESMGREVMAEVKSLKGEIPEEVTLQVRIHRDPVLSRRHAVRCLLETDPAAGRLALIPIAGQLDRAIDEEMNALDLMLRASVRDVARLADETAAACDSPATTAPAWRIPVFFGNP